MISRALPVLVALGALALSAVNGGGRAAAARTLASLNAPAPLGALDTGANCVSFYLASADAAPGVPAEEVCRRITAQTGLQAFTRRQFIWKTIRYYLAKTGIPVNFGITVFLGFLVGTAIAGQTFYLFTVENIRQFGALKAMGTSNWTILFMVLSQAVQVGVIGYGSGVGLAAAFGLAVTGGRSRLSFFMPWEVLAITAAAVAVIVLLASLLSIRRVLVVDPAIVFRG
jgi:putative ABC transport system permease protein